MLQALGITGRIKEVLEQIDSSSCEYATLKRRFQWHRIILQSNQDLSNDQIQLAVDAILTDEDLDAQMAIVLGKKPPKSPSRGLTATLRRAFGTGSERSHKSSSKRFHVSFVADSDFLAELQARSIEQPVYKETAEKIINSAGQQLCTKLHKFLEESLAIAQRGLIKVLQQEVQRSFETSRADESSRAKAELRDQVRNALANEHMDSGNRYVNPSFVPFLMRTEAENSGCVLIRGVIQAKRSHSSRSDDHTRWEISTDPFSALPR